MLPLEGVRIIAVEHYGAGPYGTTHLADMGAEVIKIENAATGGDMSRSVGPTFLREDDCTFFQALNRNKKSLSLNLKTEGGQEVLHRLVAGADGLMGNLRGDQPEKLGLTYADLSPYNPRIVCAHLSAYGRDGSRRSWPGYDYLMQAEAGFLAVTGEPDGPPARFGLSVVDFMTGMTTAFGLVSAIIAARETGKGRDVDVSLYDVAVHQLSYPAAWQLNDGRTTTRVARSGHPYIVPSQLYRTADGWIFVMCQTHRFWEVLCARLERPDLAENPDYAGYDRRAERRDELTDILDEVFSTRTTEQWLEQLRGHVPCAPVYTLEQALDNPFLAERGGIQRLPHPSRPDLALIASPLRVGAEVPARPAPALGEHTEEVLGGLDYDDAAIARLRDEGVI